MVGELMKEDGVQLASEIDRDPFKTLIRTILSARTRDDQTIKVSSILFEQYDTPKKLANADPDRVREIIRPIGFYNSKTKYIMDTSRMLIEQHGGSVPNKFKDLVALPGVGSKVANCVLVYAFGIPAIPVDTHVHRIVNRWGLVDTPDPKSTHKQLVDILPRKWWLLINDLLIRFGKEICKPIGPQCDNGCPLAPCCPKLVKKTRGKKRTKPRKPGNKK
ncbi:endonuclease III [Candidatus Bathyarchaeota archaeon]|nr:endonuclease III [Candidatus Bathyarchaeota archaeon]